MNAERLLRCGIEHPAIRDWDEVVLGLIDEFKMSVPEAIAWRDAWCTAGKPDTPGLFVDDCLHAGARYDARTDTVGPAAALRPLDPAEW